MGLLARNPMRALASSCLTAIARARLASTSAASSAGGPAVSSETITELPSATPPPPVHLPKTPEVDAQLRADQAALEKQPSKFTAAEEARLAAVAEAKAALEPTTTSVCGLAASDTAALPQQQQRGEDDDHDDEGGGSMPAYTRGRSCSTAIWTPRA